MQRTNGAPAAGTAEGAVSQNHVQPSSGVDEQAVEEIVEELQDFAQQIERQLHFSVDEDSGETVIQVIDSATNEVIRQIPPEEILTLRDRLGEVQGLLFKTKA